MSVGSLNLISKVSSDFVWVWLLRTSVFFVIQSINSSALVLAWNVLKVLLISYNLFKCKVKIIVSPLKSTKHSVNYKYKSWKSLWKSDCIETYKLCKVNKVHT